MKPMLIVIDMLVDFLQAWPPADRRTIIAAIEALTAAFHSAGQPIVWVRQEFAPDLSDAFGEVRKKGIAITIKGTPGCAVIPELTRRPSDHEIVKKRYSAFFGTPLDDLIAGNAVDTIVLAGINTHACIRMTAIDAYQRDLGVIIPREAVGSYDKEHAAMSLRYMNGKIAELLSTPDVIARVLPPRSNSSRTRIRR
jgi:nicotinamidase-related amidase